MDSIRLILGVVASPLFFGAATHAGQHSQMTFDRNNLYKCKEGTQRSYLFFSIVEMCCKVLRSSITLAVVQGCRPRGYKSVAVKRVSKT